LKEVIVTQAAETLLAVRNGNRKKLHVPGLLVQKLSRPAKSFLRAVCREGEAVAA